MSYAFEIALVMATVAAACALPGVFLVLRKMAMTADAIGHVILFGIVVAYLIVRDLASPWLMVGAAASGVLTVALVEVLQRTKLVKEDAAIGLVFPALFSVGTLLASLYLRDTHLDADRVLLGSAELAPLDSVKLFGTRVPRAAVVMSGLFLANLVLVGLFFKELKLATFDPALAATLGFRPGLLHYALMTTVSLTAVAAFDAVGPVMVVAFFVLPTAAGLMLTNRLGILLLLSVAFAVLGSGVGVLAAVRLDTNVAGTSATLLGLAFALVWLLAPGRGLLSQAFRRRRQRRAFHEAMLAIHLLQHEGTPVEPDEARADGLHRHFRWGPAEIARVVDLAETRGLVTRTADLLKLTPAGRTVARETLGVG